MFKWEQTRWYYQNRFYSRPWNLSDITTVRSGGCRLQPSEWERKRVQHKWGQRQHNKRKKKSANCIYIFCVIIQQLNPDFIFFVHFMYVTTNKSELQKFWEVQNLQGLSNIAKIELTLVLSIGTKK